MRNPLLIWMVMLCLTLTSQNDIPVVVERPADFEYLSAPDSLGNRNALKQPHQSQSKIQSQYTRLF